MTRGFWAKLKRPIFVLAPMLDVTDEAFRRVIAKYGKPDVMWTEFVSADGLVSEGRKKLEHLLWYSEKERPIVAQLFGASPKNFEKAARLVASLGFDGIDINMGCPERNVLKQGAGAALVKNPKLAREIILKTKKGAGRLPVSVKIRTGDDTEVLESWLKELIKAEPAAITIHFRTRKEMSLVPARWELAPKAMALVKKIKTPSRRPLILGNGDVNNLAEAREMVEKYGIDGVMIGRGIFGNPWLFSGNKKELKPVEKLKVLLEHASLYEKIFRGVKPFHIMKRHFKAYISGFDGAKEMRAKLMEAKTSAEVKQIISAHLTQDRKKII